MNNKEKNFISAVVYVHNSEKTLNQFLGKLIDMLEANFEHSEIICVDDDSCDESREIIKNLSNRTSTTSLSIITMSFFHGLELAMNAGVDLAIGDFVFEFDYAILDFDPQEIMNVYFHTFQGYDIVSAIPDKKERFFSRIFYKIFNKYANYSYQMHTESFRILSRRVINRIASMNKTVPYRKAIYASQGLKIDQIKYKPIGSFEYSYDKQELLYRSSVAVDSLIIFTEVGYRFSLFMTLLMMGIMALMIIYTAIVYATMNPIAGWTTTILFLSIPFFGIFAIFTIVIKYLQIIVDLVFRKKHYSFEGIEKLTR